MLYILYKNKIYSPFLLTFVIYIDIINDRLFCIFIFKVVGACMTNHDIEKKAAHIQIAKNISLAFADIILINLASFLALFLRFEFDFANLWNSGFLHSICYLAPVNSLITILVFIGFKMYRGIWKYAGVDELITIISACTTSNVAYFFVLLFAKMYFTGENLTISFPRSYPIIYFILMAMFIIGLRFSYRFIGKIKRKLISDSKKTRIMIIGAGRSGATLLRELQSDPHSSSKVVCMLDKNPAKIGMYMHGVKVIGNDTMIEEAADKYKIDQIIIAIPSANAEEKRAIIEACQSTGCTLRIVPALYQLANGDVTIEKVRPVKIDDLLGRDSIKVDMSEISSYLEGKTVMVTGGGGSIGSELCRQIASFKPKKLVIFDIYENNTYSIQQELLANYPDLDLEAIIGSVRDIHRVDTLFDTYRPDVVYHAAAHKHVPLMEVSPNEAVKNNVFGTYNVARAASEHGVNSFVLISTDKAVNPTNIMGATKRLCEMIIECFAKISKTKFVAVRFGNVLGSNGSVIPLFRSQIERGGPVTVTHKDIIRYFMTIPEAVSLVLQAGFYAKGGEIFVLDMGKPVKIDDLARKMIQLSGFKPDVDIKIEYTGLRPGEKLYEELLMSEEGLTKTANELIFIGKLSDVNTDEFFTKLAHLRDTCHEDGDTIRNAVREIVTTYTPKD